MNKWGEIARFKYDDKLYILTTFKVDNPYDKEKLYCPSFCFEISTKTAKKTRDKKMSKLDKKFSLLSDGKENFILIRNVVKIIEEYLKLYPTKFIYLGYYGYGKEEKKRMKLYSYVMEYFGYSIIKHVQKKRWWEQSFSYYKKTI